ncbi:MAG: VanZ family protein [Muribaculaceae bacterium]|nr:VanZ family protein [Muribaculaceae bacterium]
MTDKSINGFLKIAASIPRWVPSIITVLVILWLTLSPDPLGKDSPRLFPGADKVAHALMFGGLTVMILFDHTRRDRWRPATVKFATIAAAASTILGCIVEFAQLIMNVGRGFEYTDMVADLVGADICAVGWIILINPLLSRLDTQQ